MRLLSSTCPFFLDPRNQTLMDGCYCSASCDFGILPHIVLEKIKQEDYTARSYPSSNITSLISHLTCVPLLPLLRKGNPSASSKACPEPITDTCVYKLRRSPGVQLGLLESSHAVVMFFSCIVLYSYKTRLYNLD